MRLYYRIARLLLIICLPLLFVSAGIAIALNSHWLYQYGFDKYDISERTGLEESQLDRAARELIDYFNSGEEYISITVDKDGKSFELFNEREIIHLRDVKELFRLDYWILLGTIVYASSFTGASIFLKKDRRYLASGMAAGSGLTLALMLLAGLGILLNFDRLFLLFHLISFSNDFWMLDPSTDYLIMMFPQGFWFDTAIFCALAALVFAVLAGLGGAVLLRHSRK